MLPGLVIAAPASGSGKTTLTLALLRHLRDRGVRVGSLKVGPDYIDPAFHTAASGRTCLNVDPWAMREATFAAAVATASEDADLIIVEGVMGLFDGATAGDGSTADLAAAAGWPVVLVVDASAMAASAAAVVHGFAHFRENVEVAGVIYNRVGSDRHAELLVEATAGTGIPVFGQGLRDEEHSRSSGSASARPSGRAGFQPAMDRNPSAVHAGGRPTLPEERRSRRVRDPFSLAREQVGIPVLGCIRRDAALALPDRHLGLVQASEHPDLERFLATAAQVVDTAVDVDALLGLARCGPFPTTADPGGSDGARGPSREGPAVAARRRARGSDASASDPGAGGTDRSSTPLPMLGQRIAVARDEAFAFAYPLVLDGWRNAGAEMLPFSPLADEPPSPLADAVYLPGGYPELHAGRLAAARRFLEGVRGAAARGAVVYGECGGYMVLGESLVDADGEAHAMASLLPVATTFAERRLTLGYRIARVPAGGPLGATGAGFRGHEFHYARVLREDGDAALFRCADARGRDLGPAGRRVGRIMGSFVHLIDRMDEG